MKRRIVRRYTIRPNPTRRGSTVLQWVTAGAQLLAVVMLGYLIRSSKLNEQQMAALRKAMDDESVAVGHVGDAVTAEGKRVETIIQDLKNSPVAENPVVAQIITALGTSKTNLETIATAVNSIEPAAAPTPAA